MMLMTVYFVCRTWAGVESTTVVKLYRTVEWAPNLTDELITVSDASALLDQMVLFSKYERCYMLLSE